MKIETKSLSIGYEKIIVKDINLCVKDSEIVVLIGPNGTGKTTLLKTLAGLISPLSGDIYICEKEASKISLKDRSKIMASVLTEKTYADYTCEEMVAMGRYPYTNGIGMLSDEDRKIIAEAMTLTDVENLKEKDFQKISDGQKQRVLLARAICQRPEILILDEPTSFLDVKYKMDFLKLLKKLSRKMGFSVIMSLHELDMARQIADKIVCMKDDKIDKTGTVEEIFTNGYIKDLFDITAGDFDEKTGTGIIWHTN